MLIHSRQGFSNACECFIVRVTLGGLYWGSSRAYHFPKKTPVNTKLGSFSFDTKQNHGSILVLGCDSQVARRSGATAPDPVSQQQFCLELVVRRQSRGKSCGCSKKESGKGAECGTKPHTAAAAEIQDFPHVIFNSECCKPKVVAGFR